MRRNFFLVFLLLPVAGLGSAMAKPRKPAVPDAFQTAHTVFVEARDARSIEDLSLDQEDRNAILDVQDGIQDWGRYTFSRSRHDADLVLVVYKGRLIRDQANFTPPGLRLPIKNAPGQNPPDPTQASSTAAPPDGFIQEKDELRVYTIQSDGKLKGPIWRSDEIRGLNRPTILLLQRLKVEVEKAYPMPTTNKPSAP